MTNYLYLAKIWALSTIEVWLFLKQFLGTCCVMRKRKMMTEKINKCVELKGQSTGLARKQQFTVEINNLKNISVIKI